MCADSHQSFTHRMTHRTGGKKALIGNNKTQGRCFTKSSWSQTEFSELSFSSQWSFGPTTPLPPCQHIILNDPLKSWQLQTRLDSLSTMNRSICNTAVLVFCSIQLLGALVTQRIRGGRADRAAGQLAPL